MTGKEVTAERLREFREMADEARKSAERATNREMRAGFQQIAEAWDQLIREVEAAGNGNASG